MIKKIGRTVALFVFAVLMSFTVSACHVEQVSAQLYRGPDPSEKLLVQMKDMGIKSVISCRLNPQPEKAEFARKLGIRWQHVPTGLFKKISDEQVNKFCEIISDPDNFPAYVSCEVGTDRSSLYCALYKILKDKCSYDEAYRDARKHGLKQMTWVWFMDYKRVMHQCVDGAFKCNRPQDEISQSDSKLTAAPRKTQIYSVP
jgi:protein tyrosine phosphatase (PTP) superfamily phosphohydrolase (DUF442 family)